MRLLTRKEEADLAQRIRAGDREALDTLVCANLRFVVAIAKRYRHRGAPLADLIDEGNLGLLRAAGKFDESLGIRFVSYAVWAVRQAIVSAIAEQSGIVRVPRGARTAIRAADTSGLSSDSQARWATECVRSAMREPLSLDTPLEEDSENALADVIADERGIAADEAAGASALRTAVARALATLKQEDAHIVRLHFGLGGDGPFTADEIGARLGMPAARVRQRIGQVLEQLRHPELSRELAAFLA